MIIGNGDIASVLNDREGIIFFAAGVSNSSEMRESEYERELNLLKEQDKTKCIFYFSSILIDVGDSFYFTHKRKMEQYIKDNFVFENCGASSIKLLYLSIFFRQHQRKTKCTLLKIKL